MTDTPRPKLTLGKPLPAKAVQAIARVSGADLLNKSRAAMPPGSLRKPQGKALQAKQKGKPRAPLKRGSPEWIKYKKWVRYRHIMRSYHDSQRARRWRRRYRDDDFMTLRAKFPGAFDPENPRPLAKGSHLVVGEIIGANRCQRLLKWWTDWPPYLEAVARGGKRYALDGTEAGVITEYERRIARDRLRQKQSATPDGTMERAA